MQTPPYALEPLMSHIPKHWEVWEPACGQRNLVDAMMDMGYKVKWSDIERGWREDFFIYTPRSWDVIITNPPYNIKDKWLERCFSLRKPFALLLPIESLGGQGRVEMYMKYGIQLIVPNKRINFETPGESSSAWFPVAWFCWMLELKENLNFYEYRS